MFLMHCENQCRQAGLSKSKGKNMVARDSFAICALAIVGAIGLSAGSAHAQPQDQRPNVVVILADDMGFSDLGSYGSEISTPNLDRLAASGFHSTNFHVGAACSPTRTMLMTGVDNHLAGLGNMYEIVADNQYGQPGYEGHLSDSVVTVSTLLQDAGYHTYMVGKWHLGKDAKNLPAGRGFQQSFTLMESGADNWVDQSYGPMYDRVHYFEGTTPVTLPTENYFSTDFYTDKMIGYIEDNLGSGKPFFAYLSYQAVHSPHQAPKEFIDKYNGVYDAGWNIVREQRLERQKALGIFGPDAQLDPTIDKTTMYTLDDWDALSAEEQAFSARKMQAYAGMVDNLDFNIGRLMDFLEREGSAENTLVLFFSDNGADPTELPDLPGFDQWYRANYQYTFIDDFSPGFPELGQRGSFSAYGPGWARVANTPGSYFKTYSSEGGLRAPFIAYMPGMVDDGQRSATFKYVTDVVPTILEVANVQTPGNTYNGSQINPPRGQSMWPLLTGAAELVHAPDAAIGYEMAGSSAVFKGNYKLVRNLPPKGTGEWELYDIIVDPAEVRDLASEKPDIVVQMIADYEAYEAENNVISVPDGYDPTVQLVKNAQRAKK